MALKFVVLSIADNSLRSVLAARLTLLGVNVLSHEHWDDTPAARRNGVESAVLITDDEQVGAAEAEHRPWLQVLVLNGVADETAGRPVRLAKGSATPRIAELLLQLANVTPE